MKAAVVLLMCVVNIFTQCLWDINRGLGKKYPVLLKESEDHHFNLYNPTSIVLKSKEVLIAVCTGRNFIVTTKNSSVNLSCVSGTIVEMGNQRVDISNVSCTKNIVASVKILPSILNVLSIGFSTDYGWLELFMVVYDFVNSTPLFSRHILHGSNLKSFITSHGDRPDFKTNHVPIRIDWNTIYQKQYQQQLLAKYLRSEKADQYLNFTTLSTGQLVPDADFYFHSWKIATFFYANAVSIWQSINVGNWLRIEILVRNKAKYSKENLKILTGVAGVMTLGGINLYLNGTDVPVPKYIWKVVCDERDECIAFVVINNPFVDDNFSLCEDLCRDNRQKSWDGWCFSSYNKYIQGKVMFCDINELNQKSNSFKIEAMINSAGILNY